MSTSITWRCQTLYTIAWGRSGIRWLCPGSVDIVIGDTRNFDEFMEDIFWEKWRRYPLRGLRTHRGTLHVVPGSMISVSHDMWGMGNDELCLIIPVLMFVPDCPVSVCPLGSDSLLYFLQRQRPGTLRGEKKYFFAAEVFFFKPPPLLFF